MTSVIALLLVFASQTTEPELELAAPYKYTAQYLTMRDGVRIAVDVYVPKNLEPGAKVPTILHQTRYFRSHWVVWIAGFFWGGHLEPSIKRYAERGYVYVVVDAERPLLAFVSDARPPPIVFRVDSLHRPHEETGHQE